MPTGASTPDPGLLRYRRKRDERGHNHYSEGILRGRTMSQSHVQDQIQDYKQNLTDTAVQRQN